MFSYAGQEKQTSIEIGLGLNGDNFYRKNIYSKIIADIPYGEKSKLPLFFSFSSLINNQLLKNKKIFIRTVKI